MIGVLSNLMKANSKKVVVFCAVCIALCGSRVTEELTEATTGLEDIFSEVDKQSLSIKNISFEAKDNDEYYLYWFFDNGNNDDIEATIDVHVTNEGAMDFFRQKKMQKSLFYKMNIGKLEKCSLYNATLQAHNKLREETKKYSFTFETSPRDIENIQANIAEDKTSITWNSTCLNFEVTMQNGSGPAEVFHVANNANQLDIDRELYCTRYSITALSANGSKIGKEISQRIDPSPVRNLKSKTIFNTILVIWDAPNDSSCVTGYKTWLNGDVDEPKNITSKEYHTLHFCQRYVITVRALAGDILSVPQITVSTTPPPPVLSPVQNMEFQEIDNTVLVTWTPSEQEEPCIRKYNVEVNGEVKPSVNEKEFLIENSIACTEYIVKITPEGDTGTGDTLEKKYTTKVSSPVENMEFQEIDNTVLVTWTPSEQEEPCIRKYNVEVNGEVKPSVNEKEFLIENSIACTEYIVKITPEGDTGTGDTLEKKYTTKVSSPVENMEFEEIDNTVLVTWTYSEQAEPCIIQYNVEINGEVQPSVKEKKFLIENTKACTKYIVKVTPEGDSATGDPLEDTFITQEKAPNPPTLEATDSTTTSIKFKVIVGPVTGNACKLTNVITRCKALPNENDYLLPWVERNPPSNDLLVTEGETEFEFEMIGLSQHTNYTCTSVSYVGNLPSENSNLEKKTTEVMLLKPENVVIKDVSTRGFRLEWESSMPTGISYNIEITPVQPIHFIPQGCAVNPVPYRKSTTNLFIVVEALLPSFQYNVFIKSVSTLGEESEAGELANPTTTLTDASEAVRSINADVIEGEISVDIYDVKADITWKYPCNTNGKVTEFKIAITETCSDDVPLPTDPIPIIPIPETPTEEDLDYKYTLTLKGLCKYDIAVNTIGINQVGVEQLVDFESPEGFAEPPEKVTATVIDTTSFTITWEPPANPNGIIINYRVEIIHTGPRYYIPEDCENKINPPVKEIVKDVLRFDYNDGMPYHNYDIKVSAESSKGIGKASSIETTTFAHTVPGTIRDFAVKEIPSHSSGEFENTLEATFNPPCNLTGEFEAYVIHFIGVRQGFENHERTYEITDVNGIDDKGTLLKAAYNYEVSCHVRTTTGKSEESTASISSVPGVPGSSEENSITIPDDESTITFLPSSFTDINGEVLYFAILLSANYDFDRDWGYYTIWPDLGQYSIGPGRVIEPYQITPEQWAPHKTKDEEKAVTYNLGNENCADQAVLCNGLLREDTKYTVTIRGLTANGYRDMRLSFDTPSLSKSISLGVILGITFGVLSTGLIFLGSYLIYRKRMFRSKKALNRIGMVNQMRQSNGGLFSPRPYNISDDDSAQDFSALQRASERVKGVTTVAEAEQNRKKNRYVNILPFDSTRVILYDGVESDYINASFIKGYSSKNEYIAAQGPLESTVENFWRMVAQEKVTTILMLTQLREQNREKCYKYFPFNHENIRLDEINLYCAEEEVSKTYIRRKIVLDIEKNQFNIQHFQYTDWPDFNVPEGTENMIKFVKKIRKIRNQIGGVILVHCSAGVGRTGTLISIDILLQTIDDGKDWNIYQTVLDLRSQRVNMVQNEKQFLYIGSCVEDYVKSRRKSMSEVYNIEVVEPIYENVESSNY